MKKAGLSAALLLLFFSNSFAQGSNFIGAGGVYFLGAADIPIDQSVYSYDHIAGVVVRVRWSTLEPQPDVFDWQFVDGEIAKAVNGDKKVSLEVLGKPDWLKDSLGIPHYEYLNQSGNALVDYVSWHPLHVERLKTLIEALGTKYAQNTTVTYMNLVAGQMSRNLPDTLTNGAVFYQQFNYNPDTIVAAMNDVLDTYMTSFPSTPNWSSMDYQRWEPAATGHAKNYVAQQHLNYGIATYPDRFGVWREDLSGCNPNLQMLLPTSHWYLVQQHRCRNGAQMLWSVQDGPDRMNQCGMTPDEKLFVLDSAIKKGLGLGMRYMEIYGADVSDSLLYNLIDEANDTMLARAAACSGLVNIASVKSKNDLVAYPNPTDGKLHLNEIPDETVVEILDSCGRTVHRCYPENGLVDLTALQRGFYLIRIGSNLAKILIE